jgi:hypothetical protein
LVFSIFLAMRDGAIPILGRGEAVVHGHGSFGERLRDGLAAAFGGGRKEFLRG